MTRSRFQKLMGAGFAAYALLVTGSTLLPTVRAQSAPSGDDLFKKRCGGCHALDSDKEGPRLRGVVGRAAGSVASFQYSEGLPKAGITWTVEKLDQWLADPEKMVKDTDMAFHIDRPEERRAIIEYLKSNPAQ